MASHTHINKVQTQAEPNTGSNITPAASTSPADITSTAPATVTAPSAPTPMPPVPIGPPGLVKPPPNVTIPSPPAGFVPANPKDYRGFRPKSSEIASVPDAIIELQSFTNYNVVFGSTAPNIADLTQGLGASLQWTSLLADTSDWMSYVKSQDGMAWLATLTLMDKLKAPFALAAANDPSLSSRYPALARLLGAAKVIAKRGAATRARTKKAAAAKPAPVATPGAVTPAAPAPAPAAQAASPPGGTGSGTRG